MIDVLLKSARRQLLVAEQLWEEGDGDEAAQRMGRAVEQIEQARSYMDAAGGLT